MAEERLLTIGEVVERLALSRSTVMGLVARGDIPSLTIRRARRVRESALREFIEARAAEHDRRPAQLTTGASSR